MKDEDKPAQEIAEKERKQQEDMETGASLTGDPVADWVIYIAILIFIAAVLYLVSSWPGHYQGNY